MKGLKASGLMGVILWGLVCGCNSKPEQSASRWNPVILEGDWLNVGHLEKETWTLEAGGVCLGEEFVLLQGDTVPIEAMQLKFHGDAWVYHIRTSNYRPSVTFQCISESPNQLVFENKEYSFPQKITYLWGTLVQLRVYLEGEINGRKTKRIVTYLKED